MSKLSKYVASVKASKKVRNIDRRQDFGMATDALGAIFGNLQTTQRGVARTMTKANARILGNMERTAQRASRSSRAGVAKTQGKLEDAYGTAMGSSFRTQLTPARGIARSTGSQAQASANAGAMTHRAGVEAMDLLQEGTAMAKQSAKAGLAEALAIRASDDAALTAEARQELALKRLEMRETAKAEEKADDPTSDTSTLLQEAAQEGYTKAQATTLVQQQALQLNLGPQAKAKLTSQLALLYPETGPGAMETYSNLYTYEGSTGQPLEVSLDDTDKEGILGVVEQTLGTMTEPTAATILSDILKITKDKDGVYADSNGQEVAPQKAAAAVAYFQQMWKAYGDPAMRKKLGIVQKGTAE